MRPIDTIRRYELFIVLGAAAAYVLRRLFELANNFSFDIRSAHIDGVRNVTILRDLASFDYNQNVIFPMVAGATLFMAAWYVFHYYAFPRIKDRVYDSQTKWFIAFAIGLTLGSISLYSFFRRTIGIRRNDEGQMIGFRVNASDLFNFSTSFLAIVTCLFLYEAVAQVYYRTSELYEQKGQSRHRDLQYLLLIAIVFLLIWGTFFGSIASIGMGDGRVIISLIVVALMVFFHYVFYRYLIPYFDKRVPDPHSETYYASLLVIYIATSIALAFIWALVAVGGFRLADAPEIFLVLFILPSSVGLVTVIIRRLSFAETHQLQTQVLRKTTELDTLRSQVNPHFLFNALNTLYAIALKENGNKTANGIQKLGDMMRFMLHENNQERIPLRKEIEYLHNFLDLQRMRLDEGHKIEIRVNIQEPETERYLAPMLLNPFLENAFKHGISLREPSWIFITMTLDSTKLYFKVHNSLHQKKGEDPEKNASGLGLKNVRKRLDLLYLNRYTLDIQATEQDYFVSLILEIDSVA